MPAVNPSLPDRALLSAIIDYVAGHPHADVQRFRHEMCNWGEDWQPATPRHVPAAHLLACATRKTVAHTRTLTELFARHCAHLHWEQTYTRQDSAVSATLLAGYAFAEIVGKRGPFLSTRVRSGIGVWAPDVVYPRHRHVAEEVYVVLAGSAQFRTGNTPYRTCTAGDVVYVEPDLPHGFRCAAEPVVLFYIWQHGDLRQKSEFL